MSACAVVIHYEEALNQCMHLYLTLIYLYLNSQLTQRTKLHCLLTEARARTPCPELNP